MAASSKEVPPAESEQDPGPIIQTNKAGTIIEWNLLAERLFGWPAAEILGRKAITTLIAPTDRLRFQQWGRSNGDAREFSVIHRSGRPFKALFNCLSNQRYLTRALCNRSPVENACEDLRKTVHDNSQVIGSNEFLSVLLKTLPVGVWISNREGRIIQGNPAAQQIWGGAKFVSINDYQEYKGWWVDTGKRIEAEEWAMARALKHGTTSLNELIRIESFDGIQKFILNSAAPIRNTNGEIIGAVVVNQDVSELSYAKEKALALSQAKDAFYNENEFLTAVLDNMEDGIAACDSKGILTVFNRATRIFHGLMEEPIPPEQWAEHYDLYMADGITPLNKEDVPLYRALQGEKVRGLEMVISPKAAPPRRVLSSGQAIFDAKGNKIGAIVSMHDVTEKKNIEEELRQQKSLLQDIINFVPHAIFWKDRRDRFLGGNKTFLEKALGVNSIEEMIGKDDFDFFPKEQAQHFRKCDHAVMESGQPMLDIEEVQYQHGELRVLVTSKVPIFNEKRQVTGVLGSFMDITERKRMEQELEDAKRNAESAARAKSEFLATISHELRTPLTLILGPLEMLFYKAKEENTLTQDIRKELERIQRNAVRLFVLVNDILDFTKLEAGKTQVNWEPVNVSDVVSQIISDAESMARSKSIRLTFKDTPGLEQVTLDRGKFEKIVLNLLGNALKFTPRQGQIGVTLEAKDDVFVLSVSDSGPGIAPEQQHLLFQKFQQLDSSATRKFEGTGLGLALVKQFAELMGGSVGLESQPGKGSKFFVSFARTPDHALLLQQRANLEVTPNFNLEQGLGQEPMQEFKQGLKPSRSRLERAMSAAQSDEGRIPTAQTSINPSGKRILVVDDNPDMRAYVSEILQSEYTIVAAANGIEALSITKVHPPHIIVSDIMMPEMDGLELVSRLKQDLALRRIPIILLTAKSSREDIVKGLNAGAEDYLIKPFGPAELKARVLSAHRLLEIQDELIQASKMAIVGTLVAGLSHELNNPLAAISLSSQMLLNMHECTETAKKMLTTIHTQTNRCADLVRALLDYSRKKPSKLESITLQALLKRVAELALPLARQKEVELKIEGDGSDSSEIELWICVQEIETALLNLISNALEVTDKFSSILIQTVRKALGKRGGIEISVVDTGHGIPEDVLPRIFDPFFTTKPPGKGTGLGLSLAKKIIESHDGSIRVESELTQGTSVRIWLPAKTKEI